MPVASRCDFFLSRRGSVAAVAREVADLLTEKGYSVVVQDYDIPITANFVEAMHEAIKAARDLVVLFTRDYEASPYTRKEFTSFEADRAQSAEERRVVEALGPEHPHTGLCRDGFARLFLSSDQPGAALALGEAALSAHEKALGPKHPWTDHPRAGAHHHGKEMRRRRWPRAGGAPPPFPVAARGRTRLG